MVMTVENESVNQQIDSGWQPGRLLTNIPVDDPQAALLFCQALARIFEANHQYPGLLEVAAAPAKCEPPFEPVLSVILPVYCEEENIREAYRRLTKVLDQHEPAFELIFVDDGSSDRSPALLRELAEEDRRVTVIELTRNFGHQVAISAGLDFAHGRAVIVMDADLQDPPEVLPQFISRWQDGYDVVYAIRKRRKESWPMRAAYALFYRLLHKIASVDIPLDAGDFCIMDRKVVEILKNMPERNRFLRGIRSWVGLNQTGLTYERQERHAGKPKYNIARLVYLALDGLISFSYLPLRMISLGGFLVSAFSIVMAVGYTIQRLFFGLTPAGFATTVVAIFFLAGVQLITIGVIGEYIGRIFEEVKQRPLYLVRRVTREP